MWCVRDGRQIPFVFERTSFARNSVAANIRNETQKPTVSKWSLGFPGPASSHALLAPHLGDFPARGATSETHWMNAATPMRDARFCHMAANAKSDAYDFVIELNTAPI